MAIYHLSAKVGSRSNGQSSLAKHNYICREGKYTSKADELLHSESGNMPNWAIDNPQSYWEATDNFERANASLFREIEFALPVELNDEERIELSRKFSNELTTKENLPYTWAIHDKDDGNPHCHLIISERINDGIEREDKAWFKRANKKSPELGGALKTRTLMKKDWLIQTRERWAELGNSALEHSGHKPEMDHRSLKAQGIERSPGIHLGPNVVEMEERGIRTERGSLALEREEQVEKALNLENKIERYIKPKEHFAFSKVLELTGDYVRKIEENINERFGETVEKIKSLFGRNKENKSLGEEKFIEKKEHVREMKKLDKELKEKRLERIRIRYRSREMKKSDRGLSL